jgi:hypothetical protein
MKNQRYGSKQQTSTDCAAAYDLQIINQWKEGNVQ